MLALTLYIGALIIWHASDHELCATALARRYTKRPRTMKLILLISVLLATGVEAANDKKCRKCQKFSKKFDKCEKKSCPSPPPPPLLPPSPTTVGGFLPVNIINSTPYPVFGTIHRSLSCPEHKFDVNAMGKWSAPQDRGECLVCRIYATVHTPAGYLKAVTYDVSSACTPKSTFAVISKGIIDGGYEVVRYER